MSTQIITRLEQKPQDCWDLSSLFASDQDFKEALKKLNQEFPALENFKGQLNHEERFLEAIKLYDQIQEDLERLMYYSSLRYAEDISDPQRQELYAQLNQTRQELAVLSAFFIPEIQTLPEATFQRYRSMESLKPYKRSLEKIRRFTSHSLSVNEEKIIAYFQENLADSYEKIFSALTNADFVFPNVTDSNNQQYLLSFSRYTELLESPDDTLRKNAYHHLYQKFEEHQHTLAGLLEANIKQSWTIAQMRHFSSTLEASLFVNNIPISIYTDLLLAVEQNLPLLHRYYRLRRQNLEKQTLNHWDVYLPLVKHRISFRYEEAVELIVEALAPLGNEYQEVLREGLLHGWVDRYENKGKRPGAFSAGSYHGKPYILMNYREYGLQSLFTLAHEAGHSMHSYYSSRHNSFSCYQYSIFEAEIASTLNEQLLAAHLLRTLQGKNRILVLEHLSSSFVATFWRQVMFSLFERDIHHLVSQGESLNALKLRQIYGQRLEDFFGPDVTLGELASLECLRIPHFYHPFYVYQYATGISYALDIFKKLESGKSPTFYLDFLKRGGSLDPFQSLQEAGLHLQGPESFQTTFNCFVEWLDDLAVSLLPQKH